MGAKIITRDRMEIVKGVSKLYGAEVIAHDLRGGAALILAGLSAKGKTCVQDINFVDRGYYKFEEGLNSLGAEIVRK
jgi:UDP-N-acetylglucosamine 1-carboxyvinyltransferase